MRAHYVCPGFSKEHVTRAETKSRNGDSSHREGEGKDQTLLGSVGPLNEYTPPETPPWKHRHQRGDDGMTRFVSKKSCAWSVDKRLESQVRERWREVTGSCPTTRWRGRQKTAYFVLTPRECMI